MMMVVMVMMAMKIMMPVDEQGGSLKYMGATDRLSLSCYH